MKSKLLNTLLSSAIAFGGLTFSNTALAQDSIVAGFVNTDLTNPAGDESFWQSAETLPISLMAQPMTIPRPMVTETYIVNVQAVHNNEFITFRLKWQDTEKSEGGPLGKFSDGVAIQFPVSLSDGAPPLAFMGEKGKPVHIYHWKDSFQYDRD